MSISSSSHSITKPNSNNNGFRSEQKTDNQITDDKNEFIVKKGIVNNLTDSQPSKSIPQMFERLISLGGDIDEITRVKRRYPMKISQHYLSLIQEKDDPIWKQCVPSYEELDDELNLEDPLEEEPCTPVPYLIHKYPDRVLLLASSVCAMYCRFCTRKRKVGRILEIPLEDIYRAIDYIKEHKEIRDVIVSGGDPLSRPDHELYVILSKIRAIPHVEVIRIGTRMPCVKPSRITQHLVKVLKNFHPIYMNIHFNHPSEITEETTKACQMLADAGIPLGSQTVLLKGVNDDPEIMKELMTKLLRIRVKPYYIYQCDLVKGTNHFRTPFSSGLTIMKNLQGNISGLCVPHFVIDGAGGKIPVSPQYIKEISPEKITLMNYKDEVYEHPGVTDQHDK